MNAVIRSSIEKAIDGFRMASTELEEVQRHALGTAEANSIETAHTCSVMSIVELRRLLGRSNEVVG